LITGRMSTLPAVTRALTRRQEISTDMDDQLVRRSIWDKIKHAFQSFGRKIKSGFQKAGAAIKHGFQKFGEKVKSGFQKAGAAIKSGFQKFGAKVKSGFQKAGAAIKSGFQKFGAKVKSGFQTFGAKVKSGFQTAGRAIKSGFQKAGAAIKSGFQKVGKGIVYAAKKVGKFLKTTGLKILKFGTKIVEVAEQAIGKVVSFIPVIGKPLGKALEGASKVWGVISDHIPVKLTGKLAKGVQVMDKVHDVLDFVPRRRDLSEEEAFQQRDIRVSDTYYFGKRDHDDVALENREEFYFEDIYERDIYEHYDLDY